MYAGGGSGAVLPRWLRTCGRPTPPLELAAAAPSLVPLGLRRRRTRVGAAAAGCGTLGSIESCSAGAIAAAAAALRGGDDTVAANNI